MNLFKHIDQLLEGYIDKKWDYVKLTNPKSEMVLNLLNWYFPWKIQKKSEIFPNFDAFRVPIIGLKNLKISLKFIFSPFPIILNRKKKKKFFDPKTGKGPPFGPFKIPILPPYLRNYHSDLQNSKRFEFYAPKYPKSTSHSAPHHLTPLHIKYT